MNFRGPMEMPKWDNFLNVEHNIIDYIGLMMFFQTNGVVNDVVV